MLRVGIAGIDDWIGVDLVPFPEPSVLFGAVVGVGGATFPLVPGPMDGTCPQGEHVKAAVLDVVALSFRVLVTTIHVFSDLQCQYTKGTLL